MCNRGISIEYLPRDISVKEETDLLHAQIMDRSPCILVLDVLNPERYRSLLEDVTSEECISIVITDESEKSTIEADIILNGNPNQLGYDYSETPGRYLVGPKYFIMDPAYQFISLTVPNPTKVQKTLVSLGGSDKNGMLFTALRTIERIPSVHILIVSSLSTDYSDELVSYLQKSKLSYELFMDQQSLAPLWLRNDLAITSGGNTLFERIATQIPGATICQEPKQMEIAATMEKLGVNKNFGIGTDIDEQMLFEQLRDFLGDNAAHKEQHRLAPNVVDGSGLKLFYEAICDLTD